MSKYVLGVDGGGTKTHFALFDIKGNKINICTFGTTNHEMMRNGFDELEKKLDDIINFILVESNVKKTILLNVYLG